MNKVERLRATIGGEAVDRVPVALWRHFPGDDQCAEELAASTLAFQATFDWDLIKISPASSFCLKDWGVEDAWKGGDEGTREYQHRVIRRPEDWAGLRTLDPATGRLGDQLRCVEIVAREAAPGVPFIQTVFSPLSQARNLGGEARLLADLREHPRLVHQALDVITRTTVRFVEACRPLGIAGIFYAVQLASYRVMSDAEYGEFGEPYDRQVLEAASGLWLNMLHLHGLDVMFDRIARYPVHAINWHDRETPPSLRDGLARFGGAVSGGLARWDDLLRGDPTRIRERVRDAIGQTGGRRLIVASGCVAPVSAPWGNIRAVRAAVEEEPAAGTGA